MDTENTFIQTGIDTLEILKMTTLMVRAIIFMWINIIIVVIGLMEKNMAKENYFIIKSYDLMVCFLMIIFKGMVNYRSKTISFYNLIMKKIIYLMV
jgi:hypothetical protein